LLAVVVLTVAGIAFLFSSARTLFLFPVPDSYRWYGDETWMLTAWRNLLTHGKMAVPFAIGSTIQESPGFLLGSPWLSALIYGAPQLIAPVDADVITVGRTISFVLGLGSLVLIGWFAFRLRISTGFALLAIVLLLTTQTMTYATHSARYDVITGVAILGYVGATAIRLQRKHRSSLLFFIFGFVAVLFGLAISPHLEVLLFGVAIYSALRLGVLRRWKFTVSYLAGALICLILLVLLYTLSNAHFSLAEGITSGNEYSAVLNNLPVRRLFSWSAQSHQLWAKGYYLWQEAPVFAFLLPIILVSEIALRVTKRESDVASFFSISLFLVILSAAFFQSTLPYYLAHVLPLIALTFVVHLNEWKRSTMIQPALAFVSLAITIAIFLWWLPALNRAGRMGDAINEANTTAVQAAFEAEGRAQVAKEKRPLVLAQAPAIHELLRDQTVRLMSEAFLFFPIRNEPIDSTLHRANVEYIIDYDRPMTDEYRNVVHQASPIFIRTGRFLDRTVDYFHDTTSEIDTLTLYHVTPAE